MSQRDLDNLSDSNLQHNIDIKLPQQVHHHFKHSGSHDSHHLEHKISSPKNEENVEAIPEADPIIESEPTGSQQELAPELKENHGN